MSRLDELIQELCPEGVEYKNVGDLANISRGRVMSKDYIAENAGEYPVYSSQTENDGELGKISTYDFEGEYLTWTTDGANAGSVFYRNGKFSVTNVCGLIDCNNDEILTRYMYHYLSKNSKSYVSSGMGNPKLMSNVMARIKVAVPPLEVQREIVRILDSFMLLTAELTAELTARKSQYEFYRDDLLTFSNEVEFKSFGELFDVRNGLNKGKEFFGHGSPIINFTDVYNNRWLAKDSFAGTVEVTPDEIERYGAKKGDIFFTRTSETKEDIGMASTLIEDVEDCVFSGFVLRARPKTDLLLPKFCAYYFSSTTVRNTIVRYASFTTRATTTGEKLSKILVPILPKDKQEKIVYVLDNFDAICSDLNIGLPAEIEARQKQYKYYRDALLTYAATGKIIRQTDRQTDS